MAEISTGANVLDAYRADSGHGQPWSPPEMFDLSNTADQSRVDELLESGQVSRLHDPMAIVAQSMCEYYHPETKGKPERQLEYIESVLAQGDEYGTWVYYPWSGTMSHFPERQIYQRLRTSRNRPLVSESDQDKLIASKIAVIGLSVGSKVVDSLLEAGIGGTYVIGDGDHLDPTNLNRIGAGYTDVGDSRVHIAAKKISEKDPWVKQIHLLNGINEDNIEVLDDVDLIGEEVDSLVTKALIRLRAERNNTPLVSAADIDTKSIIHIENYALADRKNMMFMGRIKRSKVDEMSRGGLTPAENSRLMLKHVGLRNLTIPMMRASTKIGSEVSGIPQLGMTATKGGADVAFVFREILLGRPMSSGESVDSFRKTFGLGRETSLLESARTLIQLVRHAKSLKDK